MKRAIVMVGILALVAAPAFAQKKKDKDKRGFVWDDRPTIVFGKNINVEFKGRALVEWRAFDPDQGEDLFHLRTARLGLKGKLTKHLSWEAEREVTGDDLSHIKAGDWKDVNVEWKTFRAFTARGGRFKMPFGISTSVSYFYGSGQRFAASIAARLLILTPSIHGRCGVRPSNSCQPATARSLSSS